MTETATAPHAFPTERATRCPFDPPAEYAKLRDDEPVAQAACPAGINAWVVTRYEDVRTLLRDPRMSSREAPSAHAAPHVDWDREVSPGSIVQLDGKAHAHLRRALIPEFTVRQIERLRPYIRRIVDEHIDAMLASGTTADLYEQFALPIPSLVICELLGVPYDDRDKFHEWSAVLMAVDADPAVAQEATGAITGYMAGLIQAKTAEPADDLLSRLITRGQVEGAELSVEVLVTLGLSLLIAGHETTANQIALSTVALLRNPDQLTKLRAKPDMAPSAVEEMLRYLSIVQFGLLRQATDDVEVADRTINAGEWIVAAIGAGNRDERFFPEPNKVDLARTTNRHLAFGFGIHQCIGQQLARVELQEVYTRLYSRIPSLRLAVEMDELKYKDNALVYGVRTLPVAWDPVAG
jgi:cytochrome P450